MRRRREARRLEDTGVGYLTVISTRRFRGSGTLFRVFTARSASPCEVTSMVDGGSPAWTSIVRTVPARFRPSATFDVGVSHRVGVSDHHDLGDRERLHRFQNLGNERRRFRGERV